MTQALTTSDFLNNTALNPRQRQYFVGIIERNADAVVDALGSNGGFVDEEGEVLTGNDAREAVEEIFRDGGLEYYDLSTHEGVAFASFRGALEGRACWVETKNSLTEYPVSS